MLLATIVSNLAKQKARETFVNIYGLYDPRPGKGFVYIGATTGSVLSRLRAHISDARRRDGRTSCTRKDLWLLRLLDAGRTPSITVFASVPLTHASQAEQDVISLFRATRGPLLLNGPKSAPYPKF
jgi:hypothetical protein